MSDDQEDMVKLVALPTLRNAYASGLASSVKPKFPYGSRLLDVISIWKGDITKLEADAIVNAANRRLLGGGGVDGAIHRAAGDDLYEECLTLGGADTGDAKITKGHALPAKHVIHAVGPVYSSSNAEAHAEQLASCYKKSYELAVKGGLRSIGFCSISTGIYGYPIADATHIAMRTTREFLEQPAGEKVDRVVFVVFSDRDKSVYEELAPEYFPPGPEADKVAEEKPSE